MSDTGQYFVKKRPKATSSEPLLLTIGTKRGSDHAVETSPEDLFGRHCAVLGATGGGKSWTLARLIEETSQFRGKLILLDASGEFYRLNGAVQHLSIGAATAEYEKVVSVPYFHLREGDLFAIFNPGGPSQAPKLRSAIQSLKLARLAPLLSPDGTIFKAHRTKVDFERERQRFSSQLESPQADFEIRHLPQQIQNECVDPQRSAAEPLVWGGPNGIDLSNCVTLVNKIQDMIASPQLACLFKPGSTPSIFAEIWSFLENPDQRVLRISLRHLPFEHHAREIVGNAIGRYLLELGRADRFKKKPLVLMIDEAHQFLSKAVRETNEHFPLDACGLIAKEGRKYALTLCLSTQRPRDIPEDILSQMGMFLIHRMTNHLDLSVVERASGAIDNKTIQTIPSLLPGEAIFVGVSQPHPVIVSVRAPSRGPDSSGPDYQQFWR